MSNEIPDGFGVDALVGRRMTIQQALPLVILGLLYGLGCEGGQGITNPWAHFYRPPAAESPVPIQIAEDVEIRSVSFEQVDEERNRWDAYLKSRGIAAEDCASSDGKVIRQITKEVYRLPYEADRISYVGLTGWSGPTPGDMTDSKLREFARSHGAAFVLVATRLAGQSDVIQSVPVATSTFGTASATAWNGGRSASAYATGSGFSVTQVPVATTVNRYDTVAYFYRFVTPEERAKIDEYFDRLQEAKLKRPG